MNPCLHFASLEQYNTILSLNSIPPSLLTTLPPFPNCHLIMFPPLRLCHLTILPPFPPCHLAPLTLFPHCHPTPLTHLSYLPSSLLSHLSRLTFLPTTSRHFKYSNVLSLGTQGKHVWLIVRQPFMEAGWWDAPLALRDLAEAISILYDQWKKLYRKGFTNKFGRYFYMKIIATLIPTDLVTKLLLSIFYFFFRNQKQLSVW